VARSGSGTLPFPGQRCEQACSNCSVSARRRCSASCSSDSSNGSFYALLSLGLAVIFGMLNIINFTHGAQ
jgi:hypothetical protein